MNTQTNAPGGSIYRAVLVLALASSCASALPEQATTPNAGEETELAPVTVSAHEGLEVPYNQTGISVTILDAEELKKEGIYTISEALTTVPGVYVLPGGGAYQRGNTSSLTIRGLSSQRYVMPMMDGMRLGGGLSSGGIIAGEVVARTPMFGLGSVELVRGAQGAVYGGGAMSGILFMETPEGKGDPSLTLFSEYGSFDSYTGNATAQGRVNDTAYFFSTTYERTNNDVRYADGSRPHFKHEGKYENRTEALRLDHYLNKNNKLTLTYRREDAELRNTGSIYDFNTNLVTAKYQSNVTDQYSTSILIGYYNSSKDIGAKGTSPLPYREDLDNVQVEWRNLYRWNPQHTTTAGLAWIRTDFSAHSGSEKQTNSGNLDNVLSIFAEHSIEPVKHWNSTLALRLDQSHTFDSLITLRGSTSYKFNHERSRVYASFGRGYAAPSSFQKSNASWSSAWGVYHGNPGLNCETNLSLDFGIEQEIIKDHFISATVFWLRTEDAITTEYSADWANMYYVNAAGHQTAQGIELAMRGVFEKEWNTGYKLACTLTQPKTSAGRQIASSARQVWTADVHTSPIKGLTTGIGLAAATGRYGYDSLPLDGYAILRWYATYEVNERLSLHLRVENLTNEKYMLDHDWTGPSGTWINSGTAIYTGISLKF